MIRIINLSQFFPIEAEINEGKTTIYLHKIIMGELSSAELERGLRRELGSDQLKLGVVVKDEELIFSVDAQFEVELDEQGLANVIGDLISRLLPPTLRNRVNGNRLVYVSRGTGIPLMGRIDFGIIDRGTNLIQVRPITGCLLDCPFCSVDSGRRSKTRITDFVVDPDYMSEEVRRLCEFKGSKFIELHIDGQGEPTLYPYLPALVKEFSTIPGVETVSLQTNGVPLTEKLVDKLEKSGLSRINLSLNALDSDIARKLSGSPGYSVNHILDLIQCVNGSAISLLIAPLWIPGINDDEILRIVQLVKRIGIKSKWPILGIQNYLVHKHGRIIKGVRPYTMKHFRHNLVRLEKVFDFHPLALKRSYFGIKPMKSYPKPFAKGEIAEIEVLEVGRMVGEMVGVGRGRALHVLTTDREINLMKRIRVIRTKHNIFFGQTIGSHN
nr:radical SAM protein [Candidatus Njordarchaeum guaymaensis]